MLIINYKQIETVYKKRSFIDFASIEEYEKYFLFECSERLAGITIYYDRNGIINEIPSIDHFPELKNYEIWLGSIVEGQQFKPKFLGHEVGRNFAQACHTFMCKKFLNDTEITNSMKDKNTISGRWNYDPKQLTYQGRKLHWSERNAKLNHISI